MLNWVLVFVFLVQLLHQSAADETSVFAVQNGAIVGQPAVLNCNFGNESSKIFWQKGPELLLFDNQITAALYMDRLQVVDGEDWESNFKLDPVSHLDAGSYTCKNILGLNKTVNLYVNKIPSVEVEIIQTTVKEGETVDVGSCSALKSKPASTIWFEEVEAPGGESHQVESLNLTETTNDSLLISSVRTLSLQFSKQMNGNKYACVIKHPDVEVPIRKLLIDAINVQYAPSIRMKRGVAELENGKEVVREENDSLQVTCRAQGNPMPKVTWTYLAKNPDANETVTGKLPLNFVAGKQNGEGKVTLRSSQLRTSGLNNGTFVCTAEGDIFPSISASFDLYVYDAPTTTVAPTTTSVPEAVTPEKSYKAGGMSPVIIAILVAAICFVCIIVVIGVVRYFMTHKGEYYTNELKTTNSDPDIEDDDMDDHGGMTEAELLGSRKTEHFV